MFNQMFDDIAETIFDLQLVPFQEVELIKKLISSFENNGWDSQTDTAYFDEPSYRTAIRSLHPDWDWSEEF